VTEKPIGRGTVLAGRFRLEDLVQDNDGARFWRAIDQILARNVAVNVIDKTDPRADALLVAARTSATITEGHFLRVLDAAEEDDVVYVVHEWGTGASLDKMLTDGPLSSRRAAWLVKEVADAVTFAHGHGIAHGRLVPENVMVTEAGSVRLIGFVVDAVLHGRRQPATPDGRALSDHESDVHNLAALLYAALVGKWPGTQASAIPTAPRDHARTLRPRQVRAGIPRALDAICDRVLNPDPEEAGPETAHEISAALSDFIGDGVAAGIAGFEPTAVIERDEHARFRPAAGPGERSGDRAGDPQATQAAAPPAREEDPEATQASAPPVWEPAAPRQRRPASPPPPPLPDPEPRPLFAPGPPRVTVDSTQGPPSGDPSGDPPSRTHGLHSGHGTGSLPAVWGPEEDEPEGAGSRDAGKDWLRLAAAIAFVVLLVLAVVFAFNLGRGAPGEAPSSEGSPAQQDRSAGSSRPHTVVEVTDFDPPPGNGEENGDLAALAVDGDPATAWQTLEYYRDPRLGRLKEGVGLIVDLGDPKPVSVVEVVLQGRPTSLDLLTAPEDSGLPEGTDGLDRVASATDVGGQVRLELDDTASTRYLVVWLTSLPPSDGGFRGRIAEIVVRP
jgi:serine/threonine protein kinase